MPFPQPVSPVTFETCSPPVDDIAYDELLGSDDELDEAGRAAKRRRVERLAESYLRGNRLFIFSASLRGPFEGGWKNLWRRERERGLGGGTAAPGIRSDGVERRAEPVVQETGPRPMKYREDLGGSRHALMDADAEASVARTSPAAPSQRATSVVSRSGQKRPMQPPAGIEQNRALPRSRKKLNETSSYTTDEEVIVAVQPADWLKKDRKRMDFRNFEPPSSPTPKIGTGHAESKVWWSASRTGEAGVSKSVSRDGTPRRFTAPESVHTTPQSARTVVPVTHKMSEGKGQSPHKEQPLPGRTSHRANSFLVMSSTSQLPRFEFRRWNHNSSRRGSPTSRGKEAVVETASVTAVENTGDDVPVPDAQEESRQDVSCNGSHTDGLPPRQSRSLRFADADVPEPPGKSSPPETEQDSCENLPSAQQVSAPHEISDRMPSLHSTGLPKADTASNTAASPESQLSTQAALLHAQKSFQDDLESPQQTFGRTPGQTAASPAADDSVLLASETPYHQPNASAKALLRSARHVAKDRMQGMSTQCMLDAATPYTFSTERKPRAYRTISPQHTDFEKPRTIQNPQDIPAPSDGSSPAPEMQYQAAQFSASGSSPRGIDQPPDEPPTHRSTTQGTALPFTLSESTPTTAQDGQGGLQGAESFNLSQAIAEAGSWLQQSFDFLKEIGQPSQHA